ncbi:short-chain dehydrogenase/reductase (SDR) family protein [Tieghemostelium lacteum]|uniref:Short-chain dehydrogenase/reductase (SDR) family protein n=1 Tax=Tieghemostelium lacteum TaxID=361077 RepID=A0A151Z504_TIELA|nr:short-chain dehydrogenase/reductase (SDR) family protein [Tieghemostelium lacteum]|eukprot:KYQ88997.1 short-chain dehydrogenase/reductase (SDR) family protein [Tieghemostelium lacteum]
MLSKMCSIGDDKLQLKVGVFEPYFSKMEKTNLNIKRGEKKIMEDFDDLPDDSLVYVVPVTIPKSQIYDGDTLYNVTFHYKVNCINSIIALKHFKFDKETGSICILKFDVVKTLKVPIKTNSKVFNWYQYQYNAIRDSLCKKNRSVVLLGIVNPNKTFQDQENSGYVPFVTKEIKHMILKNRLANDNKEVCKYIAGIILKNQNPFTDCMLFLELMLGLYDGLKQVLEQYPIDVAYMNNVISIFYYLNDYVYIIRLAALLMFFVGPIETPSGTIDKKLVTLTLLAMDNRVWYSYLYRHEKKYVSRHLSLLKRLKMKQYVDPKEFNQPDYLLGAYDNDKLACNYFDRSSLDRYEKKFLSIVESGEENYEYLVHPHLSINPSFEIFQLCFQVFTNGLFEGFDYGSPLDPSGARVVISGGCITACLDPLPIPLMKLYRDYKIGCRFIHMLPFPKYIINLILYHFQDPDHSEIHKQLFERFHGEKSPYMKSDVDIFVISHSLESAQAKIQEVGNDLVQRLKKKSKEEYCFIKTPRAISLLCEYPYRPIQMVLMVSHSVEDLVTFYDIDSVKNAYDGQNVQVLPRTVHSFNKRLNIFNSSINYYLNWHKRMKKYYSRGFQSLFIENCKHRYRCDKINTFSDNGENEQLYQSIEFKYGPKYFHIDAIQGEVSSNDIGSFLNSDVVQFRWSSLSFNCLQKYIKVACFMCGEDISYFQQELGKVSYSHFRCYQCTSFANSLNNKVLPFQYHPHLAVITGERSKMSIQIIVKLLLAGYSVVTTSRFPHLVMDLVRKEPRIENRHLNSLAICKVDFSKIPETQLFIDHLKSEYRQGIDLLITNSFVHRLQSPQERSELYKLDQQAIDTKETLCAFYYLNNSQMSIDASNSTTNDMLTINLTSPLMVISQLVGSMTGIAKVICPLTDIVPNESNDEMLQMSIKSSKSGLSAYIESIQQQYKVKVGFYVLNLQHKTIPEKKGNSFVKMEEYPPDLYIYLLSPLIIQIPHGISDFKSIRKANNLPFY